MYKKLINVLKLYTMPAANVEVVVLGHQKSGTTAIAALLGKISNLDVSIDPLFHVDKGKGEVVERLINKPEIIKALCLRHPYLFGQPIVKDPDLIYTFRSVQQCYHNARFLFIMRDPRDTIRSICNRLGISGQQLSCTPDDVSIRNPNRHWRLILSGCLPKQGGCMNHLSIIHNLAHRWNMAAEIFMENSNEMECFKYEDFLKKKEESIRKMAIDIGLTCHNSVADYVDVQYQPKGDSNSDWQSFFGTENLNLIESICTQTIREFGYVSLT